MKNPYTRLPGRRWLTVGMIHKLWLGPDHLLAVAGSRYNETYQRFDYRDIQALVSRRTRRRLAIGLALGIPAILIILIGAAAEGWSGVAGGLFLTGPLLLAAAVNALRGPTCVSHLRTAVSVVELPSLARARAFERAVRMLRPRIVAAQGSLAPGEIEERLERMPSAQAPPVAAAARPAARVHPYRGAAHDVLFGLLVVLGLVGLLRVAVSSVAVSAAAGLAVLAVVLALVFALVRQQDTDLGRGVRRLVWVTIGYLVASFTLLYSVMMIELALSSRSDKPDALFRIIAGGAESPAGMLSIALSLVAIGIGIAGWTRLLAFRSSRRGGARGAARPLQP